MDSSESRETGAQAYQREENGTEWYVISERHTTDYVACEASDTVEVRP
jgi:hypothetical protein